MLRLRKQPRMPAAEDTASTSPIFEGYLTKEQLAAQLGRSPRTIDRWALTGHAPAPTRIGRTVLFRRDAVLEWLRGQESAPVRPRVGRHGAR
jgi:excisionase family DNA binding protein